MIDENAFGVLFSHFAIEEEEYGLDREPFVARVRAFRRTVRTALGELPLGAGAAAMDLGHAVYVEIADGDQEESPLGWARKVRERLTEAGFETVCVITHGGRWVEEGEGSVSTEFVGDVGLVTVSHPSEPLRRALYADAASRLDDEDEATGWGPGLYLDVEAMEALGIRARNAPTILRFAGSDFVRAGS